MAEVFAVEKFHRTVIDPDLVKKWVAHAQVKPSSLKTYMKGIRRLSEYLTREGISMPTREDLFAYRDYLGKKYLANTANLYLTAAKLFFDFLATEGIIPINIGDRIKGFKIDEGHKKAAFAPAEIKKISDSFDTSTLKGKRNKAMIALMATAGLRTIEIVRADVGDIDYSMGKYFLHVQGKGRDDKTATVHIPTGVYNLIQDYLKMRGKVSGKTPEGVDALFASVSCRNFGGRMLSTSISRIVKETFRANGFDSKTLTAHSLRHTAATTALRNHASLREVQQMLRHKNIAVTQIYLHELTRYDNRAEDLAAEAFGF